MHRVPAVGPGIKGDVDGADVWSAMGDTARRVYARHLRRGLAGRALPRHVGLVMDGNRRWARQMGIDDPGIGHRRGAEHLDDVLTWCDELGIAHVTVYLASLDNLRKRDGAEVSHLLDVISTVVVGRLTRPANPWRLHLAGRLEALPGPTAHVLEQARDRTAGRDTGRHLTMAVGYDGRVEVVDALRSLMLDAAREGTGPAELSERIDIDAIDERLYTAGLPDPDLVIRTSGEQRMSGFLLWQSTNARLHFCDAYWPAFREIDFLRALRVYCRRDD